MGRYSAGMTAAGAGAAARPPFAILSTSAVSPVLREIGIFNTTAIACVYRVVRFTGGTAGADQVEGVHRQGAPAALCLAKGLWTADVTTVDEDLGFRLQVGAAVGAGGIFTFPGDGLEGVVGSTKGIGIVPVGTGQVCEIYFVWEE